MSRQTVCARSSKKRPQACDGVVCMLANGRPRAARRDTNRQATKWIDVEVPVARARKADASASSSERLPTLASLSEARIRASNGAKILDPDGSVHDNRVYHVEGLARFGAAYKARLAGLRTRGGPEPEFVTPAEKYVDALTYQYQPLLKKDQVSSPSANQSSTVS